jgi:hypothetical protein
MPQPLNVEGGGGDTLIICRQTRTLLPGYPGGVMLEVEQVLCVPNQRSHPVVEVIPCLIPYNYVFYLKFFYQDKASFLSNQIVFSLEIRFKSKSALFSRARPSSFYPPVGPRAHAQPTHTTSFPCFRAL